MIICNNDNNNDNDNHININNGGDRGDTDDAQVISGPFGTQ